MVKVTTFAPKMLEFFHIPTVTIISHPLLSSIEPPQSKFSIYIIHFGNKLLQCHVLVAATPKRATFASNEI